MASKKTPKPIIDIGLSAEDREKIVQGLSGLLADSYTLYLMTHKETLIYSRSPGRSVTALRLR